MLKGEYPGPGLCCSCVRMPWLFVEELRVLPATLKKYILRTENTTFKNKNIWNACL